MDIILFGMQGSGKGTQGRVLANRYRLKIFEMGNALRTIISSGSELGSKIKATVEQGGLVSDDIIMEVIEDFLKTTDDCNVLFDGIPRTMYQASELLKLLKEYGRDAFALQIKITEEEAIERLTKRRICSKCKTVFPASYKDDICSECGGTLQVRSDDSNLESIKNRLYNFKTETMPVIHDFYERDRLIDVDGEQPIEDVTEEMIEKAGYLFE